MSDLELRVLTPEESDAIRAVGFSQNYAYIQAGAQRFDLPGGPSALLKVGIIEIVSQQRAAKDLCWKWPSA